MAETKKYIIYTVDNEWDDSIEVNEIGAFEGTEEEVRDYAYSFLPQMLEKEDLEYVEYISRASGLFNLGAANVTEDEAWCIVRTNSYKTCYVKLFEIPEFETVLDISEESRDFMEAHPDGIDEFEMFDLKE